MNRSGGAESQNRRRLAKFSRLVETVKLRVEWPGKMPGPAPDSHSVLANSSLTNPTEQTRVLVGGNSYLVVGEVRKYGTIRMKALDK